MWPGLKLDLTDLPEGERLSRVKGAADTAASILRQRYPAEDGYKHIRMTTKPFEERPALRAEHAIVRRGWFWGVRVIVQPADFQVREVTVTAEKDLYAGEAMMIPACLLGLASAIGAVCYSLFVAKSYSVRGLFVAFLVVALGVGFVVYGITRVVMKPLLASRVDEEAIAADLDAIGQAVEGAIGP